MPYSYRHEVMPEASHALLSQALLLSCSVSVGIPEMKPEDLARLKISAYLRALEGLALWTASNRHSLIVPYCRKHQTRLHFSSTAGRCCALLG